jgi:hypothetical protein
MAGGRRGRARDHREHASTSGPEVSRRYPTRERTCSTAGVAISMVSFGVSQRRIVLSLDVGEAFDLQQPVRVHESVYFDRGADRVGLRKVL